MYEKPQYLTPDGFKRRGSNPFKGGSDNNAEKKREAVKKQLSKWPPLKKPKGPVISDEAAKLIAEAIKGMLHSK